MKGSVTSTLVATWRAYETHVWMGRPQVRLTLVDSGSSRHSRFVYGDCGTCGDSVSFYLLGVRPLPAYGSRGGTGESVLDGEVNLLSKVVFLHNSTYLPLVTETSEQTTTSRCPCPRDEFRGAVFVLSFLTDDSVETHTLKVWLRHDTTFGPTPWTCCLRVYVDLVVSGVFLGCVIFLPRGLGA